MDIKKEPLFSEFLCDKNRVGSHEVIEHLKAYTSKRQKQKMYANLKKGHHYSFFFLD